MLFCTGKDEGEREGHSLKDKTIQANTLIIMPVHDIERGVFDGQSSL